jgi:hypothetical protein
MLSTELQWVYYAYNLLVKRHSQVSPGFVLVVCRYAASQESSLFSILHLDFPVPHGLTTLWAHSEGIWKTLVTPKLVDIASTRQA